MASDGGFSDNELALELGGQSTMLHCVAVPVEEEDARLLIELRELDQQIRIAREAKLLEQQQANRELIRNLAHEIKNPLGGIRGAAQLLERELPDPDLREFTQVIVKETDRLQSLMNRMLTPHRLPQIEMLNVHEVIERVRTLLLAEYPDGLAVRRDYDVSLPDFPGDKESLMQAILNVARNAAQAMAGRGEIGPAHPDRAPGHDRAHPLPARRVRGDRGQRAGHSRGARGQGVLPAGERARGRHRPGPVARAELRAPAPRPHRVRERPGTHPLHDPPARAQPRRSRARPALMAEDAPMVEKRAQRT